jgi:hypothetical protein
MTCGIVATAHAWAKQESVRDPGACRPTSSGDPCRHRGLAPHGRLITGASFESPKPRFASFAPTSHSFGEPLVGGSGGWSYAGGPSGSLRLARVAARARRHRRLLGWKAPAFGPAARGQPALLRCGRVWPPDGVDVMRSARPRGKTAWRPDEAPKPFELLRDFPIGGSL